MRTRVERLRVWMVVGTALVVLAVAGFLGYARWRTRAFLAGLPGRLGAEITRETNGYTYSQTLQGRTVFTLHAAKMEQRKDGVVKLHDVGVVLYGRMANRADRIYGNEFEYDQAKGVVRALGVVHMDLEAPAPAEGSGKKQRPVRVTGGELAENDPRAIHVMTSGLVYLTNLGVAATGEDVEFSEGMLRGRAHGAEFSSDTGVITLQSAVRVTGLTGGGPVVLTASRAELDQAALTGVFAGAKVVTGEETVEAARAVVRVRKDGSPERMEGSGGVAVSRPAGERVTAESGEVAVNAAGKPQGARLWGGVRYEEDDAGRAVRGTAAEARVRFDGAGMAEHVTATGDARLEEQEAGSKRMLTAAVVEASLGAGPRAGRREVRDAVATGAARFLVEGSGARTELAGDMLTAQVAGGRRVLHVVGTGHTTLRQVNAAGVDETSGGDRTELAFRGDGTGIDDLMRAVQDGHVAMVRKGTRKQGGVVVAVEEKGSADRAVYEGETNSVTLTGRVVLQDGESTVWAERVKANRGTGDATAEGGVRVSYAQDGESQGKEPVHVVAVRADLRGGMGTKTSGARVGVFYGGAGRSARMWQGTSQVEAPVIELEEGTQRMTARGVGEGMQVRTVLVGTGQGIAPGAASTRIKETGVSVVRVLSRDLVYTDAARAAAFSGGVVVEDADGKMTAREATAYLAAAKEKAAGLFAAGGVERVVATGHVEVEQPGRRGTGERLVYTAGDGMFVLTGTAEAPPRVTDAERGTTTGGMLRFHAGDDSVVVTGEGIQSAGAGKRRVETKVKQNGDEGRILTGSKAKQ